MTRLIDHLCPRHREGALRRWPIAGDFGTLLDHCLSCKLIARSLHPDGDYTIRTLPDLDHRTYEHSDAIHEAAPASTSPSPKPSKASKSPKPKPSPAKTSKRPKPKPTTQEPADVYYKNCTEVREAGAAPIRRGDPGYAKHLDRDGDGVGCAGD